MTSSKRETIYTENAPQPIGPYSQAVDTGATIFLAGQVALDPATGQLISGGIEEQTHRVLTNIKHVLEAAGTSLERVVKTTVFLVNIGDFTAFNEVYSDYFPEHPPARSTVGGLDLPAGALLEIEVIALGEGD